MDDSLVASWPSPTQPTTQLHILKGYYYLLLHDNKPRKMGKESNTFVVLFAGHVDISIKG
jgi:hypothetical protein